MYLHFYLKISRQIDPFGHSREQASLFGQMGFDGVFLGRIDYQDFNYRASTKSMEMIWQSSENLGKIGSLFTGILPNGYSAPTGYCWDTFCGEPPLNDNNGPFKAEKFVQYILDQASKYKTNNLIVTMGGDFQYSNARMWFENLDKLIFHVNKLQETKKSQINIFYSTVACFLFSLNREKTTWPLKYDDFFPYADDATNFWTGYFTSRPTLKLNVKKSSNFLQIVRHLSAISDIADDNAEQSINELERAIGVLQHHDGVSGTEKQHVAEDYAQQLWIGTEKCLNVINSAINEIIKNKLKINNVKSNFIYCSLLNITECLQIENQEKINVLVYNPLPRDIKTWINIPVIRANYDVMNLNTSILVESDYRMVYPETMKILERKSKAVYNLLFSAEIPALGFSAFALSENLSLRRSRSKLKKVRASWSEYGFELNNQFLALNFDVNGNLVEIVNIKESLRTMVYQTYCIYKARIRKNRERPSGAYIFRPENDTPDCLSVESFTIHNGNLFVEIHQVYNEYISQTIRIYENSTNAEFEWQVGPLDITDKAGREVIIKFDTDINTKGFFYTDSNGREILRRKRDFRPTWNLTQTSPVSGNYYPINSKIFIRDEPKPHTKSYSKKTLRQLSLLTDRSQGGSSVYDGSVEIMLHRRTLYDDGLGVDEPLNEMVFGKYGLVAKGLINLVFSSVEKSAQLHRDLQYHINNRPLILFSLDSTNDYLKKLSGWKAFKTNFPSNVHLLTLRKEFKLNNNQQWKSILVRVEHFYELNDDELLSKQVKINLKDVFSGIFDVVKIQELALGANMDIDELNERLEWVSNNETYNQLTNNLSEKFKKRSEADFEVLLKPMEIKTFFLYYN